MNLPSHFLQKIITCFNSISDASRKYNTDPSSIMRVCQGKNKTGGGYVWAYILQ